MKISSSEEFVQFALNKRNYSGTKNVLFTLFIDGKKFTQPLMFCFFNPEQIKIEQ